MARVARDPRTATAAKAKARAIVARLTRLGSARNREGMARYGIVARRALGVSMVRLQAEAKRAGRDHQLALALWKTGWYEARLLAALVDEPARVTAAQMTAWARDFENWADCDTAAFHLFDRTPLAWAQLPRWARMRGEFERRTAFATIAGLALHDPDTADDAFLATLALVRAHASDPRNFVKKGVSWALRSVGNRSPALHDACCALARTLAASADATERWVGRDALRDLERPLVRVRAEKKAAARMTRAAKRAARAATHALREAEHVARAKKLIEPAVRRVPRTQRQAT